jgi:predicted esterase YcpF (UPF0227 family)
VKALYIHGYNGTPDGPKTDMLRCKFRKAEIIALPHDSMPAHVYKLLDGIASELDISDDMIIGNSLGGFWANYFSIRYGIGAVLINPVVSPVKSLEQLGCSFAEDYAAYEAEVKRGAGPPRKVLIAADDEVLPFRLALDYFSGDCDVRLLKQGGHGMNDPESLAAIKFAVETLANSLPFYGIHNDD